MIFRLFFLAPAVVVAASYVQRRQFAAADAFVKETHAWTQGLTARGRRTGPLIVDLIVGKSQNGKQARAENRDFRGFVARGIAEFEVRPAPDFPEFQRYRTLLIAYLEWEKGEAADRLDELIRLAEDGNVSKRVKAAAISRRLKEMDKEERAWKAKLDRSIEELYRYMNTKSQPGA